MKKTMIFAVLGALATPAYAANDAVEKYVGVWEGEFETPIYTKLVMKPDASLTYCEVSSCRQVNCMDMAYTGSFEDTFKYESPFGKYEFTRISEDEFEGTFTHILGDVSYVYYEPE